MLKSLLEKEVNILHKLAELIAPNILTATDSVVVVVVVTLTVAMDTVLADSGDHDPSFGIRDGTSFVAWFSYT